MAGGPAPHAHGDDVTRDWTPSDAADAADDKVRREWWRTEPALKMAPYPFCRTPKECAGKGYCPKEIACND